MHLFHHHLLPLPVEWILMLANFCLMSTLRPDLDDSVGPVAHLGQGVEHHGAAGLGLGAPLVTLVEDMTVVSIT